MISHPYASFIHKVSKPARYVGGEFNSIVKSWEQVATRAVLCFPDLYDIGMSHMGTKILYSIVNKIDDLMLERCFCPWIDMTAELEERNLPLLSLESHKPLSDFDVVGFSFQYEMTFTNVFTMLKLGGIPLQAKDRTLDDPLVIAGGPCASNPEPMSRFIDVFLIGDAEERLPELLHNYARLRGAGNSRLECLIAIAAKEGAYCPALYERQKCDRSGLNYVVKAISPLVPLKIQRVVIEDLNRFSYPDDSPVAAAEAIFDRMSVEIARGCTEGCRFCQAGIIYRPVRERDPDDIIRSILSAIDKGGYDEASMAALSTADYSCISPLIRTLMAKLRERRVSLGISSLRAYGLNDDILDDIASVRSSSLTFAPEAGTQRLRNVINKNISEEDILTNSHRIFSKGWNRMKLYFMIGLPTETAEDVEAIMKLSQKVLEIGKSYQKRIKITVSISSHVPKPHTPFQWVAMESTESLRRKHDILFQKIREENTKRRDLTLRRHDLRISLLEGIITRGDDRVGWLLKRAWENGARFDGWDDQLNWTAWENALDKWEQFYGLSRYDYLSTLPTDAHLPWDHISVGLKEGFLLREYKKALAGQISPPCSKPLGMQVHHTTLQDAESDERKLICYHCGIACDMSAMKTQRTSFLKKLGAKKTSEKREQSVRENALERVKKGLTPHNFKQGVPIKYRLRYTKLAAVSLQGHLDIVRIIPRIFRRAKISVFYSEGFNPKPVMSFGPALGLGVYSIAEYVDISLTQDLPVTEVLEKLNNSAPKGIIFTGVRRLRKGDRKLSKTIRALEYTISAPNSLQVLSKENTLKTGVIHLQKILEKRWLSNDPIVLYVLRKKRLRKIDLRDVVISVTVESNIMNKKITGIDDSILSLRVRQWFGGPSLKPVEVSKALTGSEEPPKTTIRVACLDFNNDSWADPIAADNPQPQDLAVNSLTL